MSTLWRTKGEHCKGYLNIQFRSRLGRSYVWRVFKVVGVLHARTSKEALQNNKNDWKFPNCLRRVLLHTIDLNRHSVYCKLCGKRQNVVGVTHTNKFLTNRPKTVFVCWFRMTGVMILSTEFLKSWNKEVLLQRLVNSKLFSLEVQKSTDHFLLIQCYDRRKPKLKLN